VNNGLSCGDKLLCFEIQCNGNRGGTHVIGANPNEVPHFWASGVVVDKVLERLVSRTIKLLKIDVEGHETSVFQGLDFNGPHLPENMIVECYPDLFPQAAACCDDLLQKGCQALTVEGQRVKNYHHLPDRNIWFRSLR